MSEYTIKTVSGSVVRFDDAEDGLPLTNCEVDIVPKIETGNASGSVVAFSDGADNVPLKSCVITVPPTLDGISSVDVHHMNSNLLILNIENQVKNGLTLTVNPDGTIRVTGTATSNTEFVLGTVTRSLNTDYVLTGCPPNGSNSTYRQIVRYTKDGSGVQTSQEIGLGYTCKSTTRPDANGFKISIYIYAEQTVDLLYKPMFRPSTFYDPTFYKSTEFLSSVINLGRVIHGGEVDVLNGNGKDTHNYIDMGSLEWTYHPAGDVYTDYFDCYLPSDSIKGTSSIAFSGYTEDYISIPSGNIAKGDYTDMVMALAGNSRRFIICDTRYTGADALTAALQGKYLVYPLNTPEDFTVTPLSMRSQLDNNCIWSFNGDTAVTYYKYGYSYEHTKIYSTNKNLFPPITDDMWELGGINVNTGRNATGNTLKRTKYYIPVKGGNNVLLCLSGYTNSGANEYLRIFKYDKNMNFISYSNLEQGKYYIEDNVAYIRMRYYIDYLTWNNPQLEYIFDENDSPTTYESYAEPSVSILNLNREIHGGTVNVFKGTGISQFKKVNLGSLAWVKYQNEGHFYSYSVTDLWYPAEGGISRYGIGVSDAFEFVQASPNEGQINAYFNTSYHGYRIFIKKEAFASKTSAEFKAYLQEIGAFLIYKVDEQAEEPFTFTPIHLTSNSSNTLWSTEGDITVSYYSYIETDGRYLISGSTLTDIADAIREKTSIVGPINVNDFITDIMTIDDSAPDAEEVEF